MAIKTSMNIKADSTLVAGAFKEAAAKVPFSMKGMFDGLVKSQGELMDNISDNFKKLAEASENKNKDLKDAMAKLQAKINDGTIDNREERDKMQAQLDMYREQMKNLPRGKKGKKDRSDLLFEINKYAKDKRVEAADALYVTNIINDDLYDPKQMKPEQLDFLTNLANYYAGEETAEGFKVEEDENGNTVYSFHGPSKMEMQEIDGIEKEVEVFPKGSFDKMSMKDIKKMIVPKNNKALLDGNQILVDAQEYATQNPKAKFEDIYQNIVNKFENMFIDDNTSFGALVDSKLMGMPMSYKEALHSDSEMSRNILKALHDLRPGFDENSEGEGKGDGVIDKKDFKTVENYEIFVDALTNPESEQFDKDLAFNLAATYFADNEARKVFGVGERNRKGTGNDGNRETATQYQMPGNQYVNKTLIDGQIKLMNDDPENIGTQIGWDGTRWRKKDGQYQYFDFDTRKFKDIYKESLRISLSFDERLGYNVPTITGGNDDDDKDKNTNNLPDMKEEKKSGGFFRFTPNPTTIGGSMK